MSQVTTVNVIEYASGTVQQVISFFETEEGNQRAEQMFIDIATANGMDKEDSANCLDDGIYEQGDYQVFIVHSS